MHLITVGFTLSRLRVCVICKGIVLAFKGEETVKLGFYNLILYLIYLRWMSDKMFLPVKTLYPDKQNHLLGLRHFISFETI